ncbi:putative F-box domain-containing protein [Medicago truncatula]|uniref:Putative F-box domain-containing protein n=1 Tax=Medicago truncatula TaxID=3880 RepID=A0A396J772_MEDTR|nr:F-box/kelch-repeat protein At3g23880 [Medicago truncatula]RHN72395.1 putative F-box domain-containing protein [Medicago truncatula]
MGDGGTTFTMAPPSNETDEPKDAALSDPNSSAGTLTSPSSSSITPGDSLPLPLPTLPFEIQVEILSRLPVKYLMQFQCVCKLWKSQISKPDFVKKHLRVSNTRHLFLLTFSKLSPELVIKSYPLSSVFTEMTPTFTQLEYPLNNRDESDSMVGSCHGILCIQCNLSFPVLWNPSIRKFTKLPSFEFPQNKFINPTYAFGYDHSSDTYKVVAVFCTSNIDNGVYQLKTLVNVHTMGTNCWRRIQTEFPFKIPFTGTGIFC